MSELELADDGGHPPEPTWDQLAGTLPVHADEVMASHSGRPTIDEQDQANGAGIPAADHGATEQAKYGC